MVISADTSFLFSFYGNDSHSPRALDWTKEHPFQIQITVPGRFELSNALRFSESRKFLAPGLSDKFISQFESDIRRGLLSEHPIDLAMLFPEADRISARHTLGGGHRSFDILHIAAAKLMRATHFLTFDANQKSLAEKEGLTVPL